MTRQSEQYVIIGVDHNDETWFYEGHFVFCFDSAGEKIYPDFKSANDEAMRIRSSYRHCDPRERLTIYVTELKPTDPTN